MTTWRRRRSAAVPRSLRRSARPGGPERDEVVWAAAGRAKISTGESRRDLVPRLDSDLDPDLARDLPPDFRPDPEPGLAPEPFADDPDLPVDVDPVDDPEPDRESERALRLEPPDVVVAVADANGSVVGASADTPFAEPPVLPVGDVVVEARAAVSLVMMVFFAAALRARALRL